MNYELSANNVITPEKPRDLRGALRVLIWFLVLGAALAGVLVPVYGIKSNAAATLYQNLTFTRIAVEARQNIQKIEYGIKNGKNLEQFFGINSILRDIGRSSSYVEGIYIVGSGDTLLYSFAQPVADRETLRRPQELTFVNENDFYVSESDLFFDLFLPIFDADGVSRAFLIMRLDKEVVSFSISELIGVEMRQSLIIGLELLGLGLIIISLRRPKTNGVIALVLIFALIALTLDMALSYNRFSSIAQSATTQSANRIAQMLQSDIDSLTARGVSPDLIYDVNSWLQKSVRGITMIHTMSIDSNMRITLTPSQEYINGHNTGLLLRYAAVYAGLIAVGTAVIVGRVVYLKKLRIDIEISELEGRVSN